MKSRVTAECLSTGMLYDVARTENLDSQDSRTSENRSRDTGRPSPVETSCFKTFLACLVNSTSKLPDTEETPHNFLLGNSKLYFMSEGEEKRKLLELQTNWL